MSSLLALQRATPRHVRMFSRAAVSRLGLDSLPPKVRAFVEEKAALCKPDKVYVCDGSQKEYEALLEGLEKQGTVAKLNPTKRPGCYIAWTSVDDVARAEADTFICSSTPSESGPTNNWVDEAAMKQKLGGLFDGSMRGRTMYVLPFSMGPLASPFSKYGVELTDSAYVAASMRVMTRMGSDVMAAWGADPAFVPCLHSVGRPITKETSMETEEGRSALSAWPCNIKSRNISHFPNSLEIWSFGSGYGGNSLLGKKCFALRIASIQAQKENWLAEHMLILGITNPQGEKRYIAAAFPSACGKTNLAMMEPSLPGWKVEVVGDDIAWLRPGKDGRLYAINPEYGFFGVAPGTSIKTNPNALKTCQTNSLFTNVGMTEDGDVWWEGMGPVPKGKVKNWKQKWVDTDTNKDPIAQPNSRFTTPISQCPVLDSKWEDPAGVPIDAIIFGGRRNDTIPLVFETFSWQHGTFVGSTLRSNATSASDQSGLVNDPMAMKAFCGYNIKDYFAHWLHMGKLGGDRMPKVYQVNWFQKDANGKFIWPGFGENSRVLEWIFNRVAGKAGAIDTPVGRVPDPKSFNVSGLGLSDATVKQLFTINQAQWLAEAEAVRVYYQSTLMADKRDTKPVPKPLIDELNSLVARLLKQQ